MYFLTLKKFFGFFLFDLSQNFQYFCHGNFLVIFSKNVTWYEIRIWVGFPSQRCNKIFSKHFYLAFTIYFWVKGKQILNISGYVKFCFFKCTYIYLPFLTDFKTKGLVSVSVTLLCSSHYFVQILLCPHLLWWSCQ